MRFKRTSTFAVLYGLLACGGSNATKNSSTGSASGQGGGGGSLQSGSGGAGGQGLTFGGDRPVTVQVPDDYNADQPAPLLILLHGYSFNGAQQNAYWGIEAAAMARGMLFAHPDGTKDSMNNRFWNATKACCDMGASNIDDVSYLRKLVTEIQASFNVDPKRIYFSGHSNGSFMSYRMACENADLIAGIAGLAGAMWNDPSNCTPSDNVSVLHIHGTNDTIIDYAGGAINGKPYPSAQTSLSFWANHNGCDSSPKAAEPIDLDNNQVGAETTVEHYTNCQKGSGAELWTIVDGSHIPPVAPDWMPKMLDWLLAHPKP